MDFKDWAIERHELTNHFYSEYLPYRFHLEMVVQAGRDFSDLIPNFMLINPENVLMDKGGVWTQTVVDNCIIMALYGHDLIEDARVSYNDILKKSNKYVAELIFALTDNKGRNRDERHSDAYYEGLKSVPGAVFCKLCDRIANIQYSVLTKSRMTDLYFKEHTEFRNRLYSDDLKPMWDYIDKMFTEYKAI